MYSYKYSQSPENKKIKFLENVKKIKNYQLQVADSLNKMHERKKYSILCNSGKKSLFCECEV